MLDQLSFLQKDVNVTMLSAFKTEARTRYLFDVTSRDDISLLPEVFFLAKKYSLPILLVGGGTNTMFAFDTYEGVIIHNRYTGHSAPTEVRGRTLIEVHSGELTTPLALSLYQAHGISTLIPWVGLPGTMGGALVGNAGCFGWEMSDMLISAHILSCVSGEIEEWTPERFDFHYRESRLKGENEYFVIDMTLDVSPHPDHEHMRYAPSELQAIRRLKQPPGFSCGSFFKNPPGKSAGRLIDEAGLKGLRIGGVKVSEQHGNFFINDEKSTATDILELRDVVRSRVLSDTGISLEEEVRIIS